MFNLPAGVNVAERQQELLAEMQKLARHDELTNAQEVRFETIKAELAALEHVQNLEKVRSLVNGGGGRTEGGSIGGHYANGSASAPSTYDETRHPLAYGPDALRALQGAIDTRSGGRFYADGSRLEERAALTTTTVGQPAAWASNGVSGPRMLHRVANVPQERIEAVGAEYQKLALPAVDAGVGENASLVEYASSTAGTVTLKRYGRYTDLSRESMIGTSSAPLVSVHVVAIARDLDDVLVTAVEADAGTAVAFSADVPAAIRKAIAVVLDNTAADDPSALVILIHPNNTALLEDVTPTGGQTIGERFQRFSGALVYPSSAVTEGLATVCNLQVGARFFEARPTITETDVDVKTGTLTVATSVIAGYGTGLVGSYASKVDIVTP